MKPRRLFFLAVVGCCAVAWAAPAARSAPAGRNGQASREDILLGMHFLHGNLDCNARTGQIEDIIPSFWDYVRYMPEDLQHMSYADFWHWWYEFERYKGDEKGLEEMDAIVDACLDRGMKVKIDLAWSTWWTEDLDWETGPRLARGPGDLDDWIHLCDLLARRYRGRVAVWHLQGEANDLKNYWQGKPIEFVHEIYRLGSRAMKRADPGARISISGASPSVPKEALDEWVRSNVAACKGLFDDVPMNYFADVADPYRGLANYYGSIRRILDEHGEKEAEVGSGESSFQWAETSYDLPKDPPRSLGGLDPEKLPLCELKQAWRFNDSVGTFFDLGGNKFVLWGTEYAPGGGWPWRWGFRKYEDWWGSWPETHKIPGTRIVYRFDPPDGRTVDLRPGWSSRPTDPFHPIWEVYKFWAQATPPGAEAVRIPAEVRGAGAKVLRLATYLQARDSCVALLQRDAATGVELKLDLTRTGWEDGENIQVSVVNESIEYGTGALSVMSRKDVIVPLAEGEISLAIEPLSGFTTLWISRPPRPAFAAEVCFAAPTGPAVVGRPLEALVVLRHTGGSWLWERGFVTVGLVGGAGAADLSFDLPCDDVRPGELASVPVKLPAPEAPGHVAYPLRLRIAGGKWPGGKWFGPLFFVSAEVADPDVPRKLVAHRGAAGVKVQWFAPLAAEGVKAYELYRAEGFGAPAKLIATVEGTEYLDKDIAPDKAFYYHAVAIGRGGHRSRPSAEDNAKRASRPRLYDAEVFSHDVPAEVALGDPRAAKVTLRNTGTKAWDLSRAGKDLRFHWAATRLWGEQDEAKLPRILVGTSGAVQPGETVTLSFPYVGPKEGRFENHWILTLEPEGKMRAYFGMPLLVETLVKEARS